jgi:uncharacterized SAM-binding protein YcdF (DUF218 family)
MSIAEDARTVWDYQHVNDTVAPADCIIVLGSHDTRVAERGAQLFLDGYAPLVVFSGHLGALTSGVWTRSEAEIFADVAAEMGVPRERMLLETRATHTGENVLFTRRLLDERGLAVASAIAVQKPYMERRTLATFQKRWPELQVAVTSPQIDFESYPNHQISRDDVIHIMLGDLQRLSLYAAKGWSAPQEIPAEVKAAYDRLVAAGYTRRLVPNE